MPRPRVLILRAPGTNCDVETAFAFETAGGAAEVWHINQILQNAGALAQFQILCIPGGFSYGDDVAAGRILASQIQHHLYEQLVEFRDAEKLILGICNGFQVLLKSGLFDASARDTTEAETNCPQATLTWNDSGKFEDRWVYLRVAGQEAAFLSGIERMYLPVAHAEGKFVARDDATLDRLDQAGQLVLRYTSPEGSSDSLGYPLNPNGSLRDVAGVTDPTGRVLGLMPHPERHIDRTHHPRWTRGEGQDPGDGLAIFQNAVRYF